MSPLPEYDLGTARGTIELDASSLGRAEQAFMGLGKGLLGFSALAVGGFAYVVKAAADFEHIMSAVEAVSGASVQQMEQLKARALEIGSSSVFSADEVGRAMEQLAKAGISVEDILGGATEATVNLAAAAGDELPGGVDRAAEVIANAMKTFDAGADSMDHFANVIVGAAASSTINVDDLANTLSYAGPIAHELGLSIDDLSTAVAILGDRGIKGSTAGTSLRGVLLSLTPSSTKARNAMQDLGLITADGTNRFYDMNGALKPLPEVMEILKGATEGLSEQQKVSAFNAIFQRRAMNSALIMADAGAAGFDQYAAAIAGIDASDVAATKIDNLTGDMTILKNSIDSLVISVGMEFQDMLRGWVQGLTGVVNWLQTLDPVMLANILKAIAFAGAIAGLLGGLSLAIGIGLKMYRNFKLLAEGIRLVMGAVRLLTSSLLLNPWFLLAAAIVALGFVLYDLYKKSNDFRIAVDQIWQAIYTTIAPIIDKLVLGFRALIEAFKGEGITSDGFVGFMERVGVVARAVYLFFRNEFIPGIQAFFSALAGGGTTGSSGFIGFMERAGVVVREIIIWLIDVGIPAFIRFAQAAVDMGKDIFNAVTDFVVPIFEKIAEVVTWLAEEVIERLVSAFNFLNKNVFPTVYAAGELVVAIIERIASIISWLIDVVEYLWPAFNLAFTGIQVGVENFFTILKNVFTAAITIITTIWENFGDNLFEFIDLIWDHIVNVIETFLGIIRGIIQVITGIISGDWDKAWEGIKTIFESIWNGMKAFIDTIIRAIKLIIETFVDTITTTWSVFWTAIKTVVETIWTGIQNFVETAIENIVGFIGDIPSKIAGFVDTIWDGFIGGVETAIGAVVTAFTNLPGALIGLLGNIAGAALQVGESLIGGIVDGIGAVIDTALDLADAFLDALKGAWNWLITQANRAWNAIEFDLPGPLGTIGLPDNVLNRLKFHEGGMVPGRGEVDATLLGGEAVLSRQQVAALRGVLKMLNGSIMATRSASISQFSAYPTPAGGDGGEARGGDIRLSFAFSGMTAADIAAIKNELSSDKVLDNIVVAVRAGARG